MKTDHARRDPQRNYSAPVVGAANAKTVVDELRAVDYRDTVEPLLAALRLPE